jgi:cell division protein FtsZ
MNASDDNTLPFPETDFLLPPPPAPPENNDGDVGDDGDNVGVGVNTGDNAGVGDVGNAVRDVAPAAPTAPANEPPPLPLDFAPTLRVKVIGVGDAGTNILSRLRLSEFPALARAAVDTDAAALARSTIPEKVHIGQAVTRGLGTGGENTIGTRAAEADKEALERLVAGQDLVFLIAGLGGGTGSGVAPIIARIASAAGALVVAFVAMPFSMEGSRHGVTANAALVQLRLNCAAAIPVHNDLLMQIECDSGDANEAFAQGDSWIGRGVSALCAMLFKEGRPKVDMATLRRSFPQRDGKVIFSLGRGTGENALADALAELQKSPLVQLRETRTATTIVVSIRCGIGVTLASVQDLVRKITEKFGGNEQCTLSLIPDEALNGTAEICIIGSAGGIRQRVTPSPAPYTNPAAYVNSTSYTTAAAYPRRTPTPAATAPTRTLGDAADAALLGTTDSETALVAAPQPKTAPEQTFMEFDNSDGTDDFFVGVETDLIDGQNIDIPTYFRRGIKVAAEFDSQGKPRRATS